MVRISKKAERRNQSPRKPRTSFKKTGARTENLPLGYKEHPNAVEGDLANKFFISKIK
jgi:hypothetical protein